jgi:putative oxidoreductase
MPGTGRMSTLAQHPIVRLGAAAIRVVERIPASLPQLVLRVTVAIPFWRSGLTKWDGFLEMSQSNIFLFQHHFKLHLFGSEIAYPIPKTMAFLSGVAEIVLPILLVLGLATRFAALALLVMTGIIQLTIPDGWLSFHLPWAAMLLAVLVHGPGRVSLDHMIRERLMGGR